MVVKEKQQIQFIDLVQQQSLIRQPIEKAIHKVLDHGQYIMGPEVTELEEKLAAYTNAKHVITCSSGTDALLMALMAYGVGPGDAVLVPAFTFPATPEVVALLGATPVFVDVDMDTFNISMDSVMEGIAYCKNHHINLRGIMAVDLYGLPADYDALNQIASEHNLWVVGDAAQSFGGEYKGKKVGTLANITATSFFPAKPLGCYGDGGAVFTDNDDLAHCMRSIRVHGKGEHKYDNVRVGINGRLDTIQAAILLEKLKIYPQELQKKQQLAGYYNEILGSLCMTPSIPPYCQSAWAQYTITLHNHIDRCALQKYLKDQDIPTMVYYPKPLHHQKAYEAYPAVSSLIYSERLCVSVLSLPMHAYLLENYKNKLLAIQAGLIAYV